MFSVDFFERPSITELKEHDWCKGPVPTHSEVILEYIERYTLYAEYSLNNQMDFPQINEEKLTQDISNRGGDSKSISDKIYLNRSCADFCPGFINYTSFFSTSCVTELFTVLLSFLISKTSNIEISDIEYSVIAIIIKSEDKMKN